MSADLAKGKVKSLQWSDLRHERRSLSDGRISAAQYTGPLSAPLNSTDHEAAEPSTYKLATAPVSGAARNGVTASCPE